jgi:hypothetical protein
MKYSPFTAYAFLARESRERQEPLTSEKGVWRLRLAANARTGRPELEQSETVGIPGLQRADQNLKFRKLAQILEARIF